MTAYGPQKEQLRMARVDLAWCLWTMARLEAEFGNLNNARYWQGVIPELNTGLKDRYGLEADSLMDVLAKTLPAKDYPKGEQQEPKYKRADGWLKTNYNDKGRYTGGRARDTAAPDLFSGHVPGGAV
jgi:hypothetical protein